MEDKIVVKNWLQAYKRLHGSDYKVVNHPDERERNEKAIDALCENSLANRLAIEHTLIQPFLNAKKDTDRFLQTLAALEDNQDLIISGYTIHASQPVSCVPGGVKWASIREGLFSGLKAILPSLAEGGSRVAIPVDGYTIPLTIWKTLTPNGQEDSFKTSRSWPGDPGPQLALTALKAKIPKLSKHVGAKKILLLEKDAVAGTIESQFEQLPATSEVQSLLDQIDEIWSVNTVSLERESVLFTNAVWPNLREHVCSLNLTTGELWQAPH